MSAVDSSAQRGMVNPRLSILADGTRKGGKLGKRRISMLQILHALHSVKYTSHAINIYYIGRLGHVGARWDLPSG